MKWKILRMISVADQISPDFHEPQNQAAAPTTLSQIGLAASLPAA